jgi:hypothetical protein
LSNSKSFVPKKSPPGWKSIAISSWKDDDVDGADVVVVVVVVAVVFWVWKEYRPSMNHQRRLVVQFVRR